MRRSGKAISQREEEAIQCTKNGIAGLVPTLMSIFVP